MGIGGGDVRGLNGRSMLTSEGSRGIVDCRDLVRPEKRTKGRGEMDSVEVRFGLPALSMLGSWSHLTHGGIDASLVHLSAVMAGWLALSRPARELR